jgi:hypothetical protein
LNGLDSITLGLFVANAYCWGREHWLGRAIGAGRRFCGRRLKIRPSIPRSMSFEDAHAVLAAATAGNGLVFKLWLGGMRCGCRDCVGKDPVLTGKLYVAIPAESRSMQIDIAAHRDIEKAVNLALGAINGWLQLRGEKSDQLSAEQAAAASDCGHSPAPPSPQCGDTKAA